MLYYLYNYWWKWTSPDLLEKSESKILSNVKTNISLFFQSIFEDNHTLRTLKIENESNSSNNSNKECKTLLLLHGMGAGIGLWNKNLDPLSNKRNLYAVDMLGFARSSRYNFPDNVEQIENIYVDSIEEWRQKQNIDDFILLGHSMGGYLAYAYALRHPKRVRHLILADPWGFTKRKEEVIDISKLPFYYRVMHAITERYSLMTLMRLAGPMGHYCMKKFRSDLGHHFYRNDENAIIEKQQCYKDYLGLYDYIYHCNAQEPSGELAYKYLAVSFGWAKNPMIHRCKHLDSQVPVTFLYGEKSYMDASAGIEFHKIRTDSYVDVKMINDAGHHIYSEGADQFNKIVNGICEMVDNNDDQPNTVQLDVDKLKQTPPSRLQKQVDSKSKSNKNQ